MALIVHEVIAQLVESAFWKKVAAFPRDLVADAELKAKVGFVGETAAALRAVPQSRIWVTTKLSWVMV